MKAINFIFKVAQSVYGSSDVNLFGSVKRRKAKSALAGEFKNAAADTSMEIEEMKTANPFESAAAKSAMAKSSRNAKIMKNRMANMMGAGATPEAIIAGQGAATAAEAAAMGEIATGAEANQAAQIAQLRGIKEGQMQTYGGIKKSAEEERGSGWNTLFQGIDALAGVAEGLGSMGIGGGK